MGGGGMGLLQRRLFQAGRLPLGIRWGRKKGVEDKPWSLRRWLLFLGFLAMTGVVLDRLATQFVLNHNLSANAEVVKEILDYSKEKFRLAVHVQLEDATPSAIDDWMQQFDQVPISEDGRLDILFHIKLPKLGTLKLLHLRWLHDKMDNTNWDYGSVAIVFESEYQSFEEFLFNRGPTSSDRSRDLFLFDGDILSGHFFKYLEEAHKRYGWDKSIAGIAVGPPHKVEAKSSEPLKLHVHHFQNFRAFSPNPETWQAFKEFYDRLEMDSKYVNFEPYVEGIAGSAQTLRRRNFICYFARTEPVPGLPELVRFKSAFMNKVCAGGGVRSKSKTQEFLTTLFARFTYEHGQTVVYPDHSMRHSLLLDSYNLDGQVLLDNIAEPKFYSEFKKSRRAWGFTAPEHLLPGPINYPISQADRVLESFLWKSEHSHLVKLIADIAKGKLVYLLFVVGEERKMARNLFCNMQKLSAWPSGVIVFVTVNAEVQAELKATTTGAHVAFFSTGIEYNDQNAQQEVLDLIHVREYLVEDLLRRGIHLCLSAIHQSLLGNPFEILDEMATRQSFDIVASSFTNDANRRQILESYVIIRPTLSSRLAWINSSRQIFEKAERGVAISVLLELLRSYQSLDTIVDTEKALLFGFTFQSLPEDKFVADFGHALKPDSNVLSVLMNKMKNKSSQLAAAVALKNGFWFLQPSGKCVQGGGESPARSIGPAE